MLLWSLAKDVEASKIPLNAKIFLTLNLLDCDRG
jgi:hypothetical protein